MGPLLFSPEGSMIVYNLHDSCHCSSSATRNFLFTTGVKRGYLSQNPRRTKKFLILRPTHLEPRCPSIILHLLKSLNLDFSHSDASIPLEWITHDAAVVHFQLPFFTSAVTYAFFTGYELTCLNTDTQTCLKSCQKIKASKHWNP